MKKNPYIHTFEIMLAQPQLIAKYSTDTSWIE